MSMTTLPGHITMRRCAAVIAAGLLLGAGTAAAGPPSNPLQGDSNGWMIGIPVGHTNQPHKRSVGTIGSPQPPDVVPPVWTGPVNPGDGRDDRGFMPQPGTYEIRVPFQGDLSGSIDRTPMWDNLFSPTLDIQSDTLNGFDSPRGLDVDINLPGSSAPPIGPVPSPGTLVVLGAGLGLGFRRQRR